MTKRMAYLIDRIEALGHPYDMDGDQFDEFHQLSKELHCREAYGECRDCGGILRQGNCSACNPQPEISEEARQRNRSNRLRSRAKAMAPFGSKCRECGCDDIEKLQLHHKDGAVEGGRERVGSIEREAREYPERFVLLCRPCHGKAHRGDPNMGGKAGWRKQTYRSHTPCAPHEA